MERGITFRQILAKSSGTMRSPWRNSLLNRGLGGRLPALETTQNLTFALPDFTVEIELPGFQYVTEELSRRSWRVYENQVLDRSDGALGPCAMWRGDAELCTGNR
jgi:hypothetical protein